MTREEAIQVLQTALTAPFIYGNYANALNMAIEALSAPIVAKHFDIQSGYIYCSPQIAENVKVVVLCKDCKNNYNTCTNHGINQPMCDLTDRVLKETDFCSFGERREP